MIFNRIAVAVGLVAALVGAGSLAYIATQQAVQTSCLRAVANQQGWMAIHIVSRDFSKPAGKGIEESVVRDVNAQLRSCLGR